MNHIGFDDEVLVEKRSRLSRIGMNSADFGCGQEDDVYVLSKKSITAR
ncbi:hypothetical protein OKW35_009066 [Paraburkholderia sp. MM5477-R1]